MCPDRRGLPCAHPALYAPLPAAPGPRTPALQARPSPPGAAAGPSAHKKPLRCWRGGAGDSLPRIPPRFPPALAGGAASLRSPRVSSRSGRPSAGEAQLYCEPAPECNLPGWSRRRPWVTAGPALCKWRRAQGGRGLCQGLCHGAARTRRAPQRPVPRTKQLLLFLGDTVTCKIISSAVSVWDVCEGAGEMCQSLLLKLN